MDKTTIPLVRTLPNLDILKISINQSFTVEIADASSGGNVGVIGAQTVSYSIIGGFAFLYIALVNINTAGMNGANDLYIRGLPNVPLSNSDGTARVTDCTFTGSLVSQILSGVSAIRILESRSGTSGLAKTVSSFTSGTSDIVVSICYNI